MGNIYLFQGSFFSKTGPTEMKAIILAAGQDSRLSDICSGRPKCLMDIEGNTLLEIQINTLHACGIEDICVVRGYEADKINVPGLRYYDNHDYRNTDTLYSLFCAEEELTTDVLILYADIIYEEQVVKKAHRIDRRHCVRRHGQLERGFSTA